MLFSFFGHFVQEIDLFSLASFSRREWDGTPSGEIVTKRLRKQLTYVMDWDRPCRGPVS